MCNSAANCCRTRIDLCMWKEDETSRGGLILQAILKGAKIFTIIYQSNRQQQVPLDLLPTTDRTLQQLPHTAIYRTASIVRS